MTRWHRWTEEERQIIRRDYKHTHQSAIELAEKLTLMSVSLVTEYAVKGQISAMGIARNGRRPWTPQEKERLEKLIGQYCPSKIARIMHRSINSVVVMSKRLKLSRRARDGWFTKIEACQILGVDHKWLQRRIDCGSLKASYHYDQRPGQLGGSAWHIAEADLRDFIRRCPQEINGRNVDIIQIVEILVGIKGK